MASGGYRPAMGVDQHLQTAVATDGVPGQRADLQAGTDFPIVCETCLGPNPYVRMIKLRLGEKLCKVSNVPMQAFRWKAGPQGRFKETIVCREVAVEKNVCQACLTDMTFGVPVGVRDALLRAGAESGAGGYAEARSNANQAHYYAQRRREVDEGAIVAAGAASRLEPSRELLALARQIDGANRNQGTAFRNLPKICSFWMAGTCTRVGKKTCPFRPCCGLFKFPELASKHREECAALVADLKANGAAAAMATCPIETRQLLRDALSVNKEQAIRDRAAGKDDTAARYTARARESRQTLEPPKDENLTTLWVGGVDPSLGLNEADFVDQFYSFGEIRGVRLASSCAFVEFATREAAEAAAGDRDSKPPALAAALGRFLCRARAHAADAGEGNVARARVVVLKAADDDASQYHAIMNCVFAARRRSVLIDACSLGPRPSSLMKQAAHLTRGAFVHVPPVHIDRLTAVSLSALSADSSVRARVSLPVLEDADMRVACVCCAPPKILDRGYVCTTCLSVFCDADATCPCSRHVLRAMDVG
mmetsp:Transcript_21057/g.62850  ORF Transcript_21057/g.62850 Transcript_21057/m.62850 type:complete len:537 (+) Transcript_21057:178-1788(+)